MPRPKSPTAQTPVSNAPLTVLELHVAVEFVSAAATTYIDHSCNDFDLPDTPTRRALVQAAIDFAKRSGSDAGPLHAQDGVIYFHDHLLMQYLGPRWEALSKRAASGPIAPALCRDELETMANVLDTLASNDYEEYASLREAADYALPLTPEGQQLAEGAIRLAAGNADKPVKAAKFGYDIHAVKCLKYLAARCQAFSAVSPDQGLAFTGEAVALPRRADPSIPSGGANAIPVLKRPDVGPSWLTAWKKEVASQKGIVEEIGASSLSDLTKKLRTIRQVMRAMNFHTSVCSLFNAAHTGHSGTFEHLCRIPQECGVLPRFPAASACRS